MRKGICILAVLALTVTVVAGPRAGKGRDKAPKAPERASLAVMQAQGVRAVAQTEAIDLATLPRVYARGSETGDVSAGAYNAYVFKNDYFSGYGVFNNHQPDVGPYYPGTMIADEAILGNGFVAGGTISAFEVALFRSSLDPTNDNFGATLRISLWDGDPFGVIDTAGGGFSNTMLTSCTFVGVPGPLGAWFTCIPPAEVTVPNDRVWFVIDSPDDPASCRLGWYISFLTPDIGSVYMGTADVFELNEDYDGQIYGGTCCDTDDPNVPPCDVVTNPCVGDTNPAQPRGFCSDGTAESAGLWYFGGPCAGLPTDSCATFVGNIYASTDTWVGVLPVDSTSTKSIDFNTITLDDCSDTEIEFEIKIQGFDPDTNDSPQLKTWEVDIYASGYYFDIKGEMTPHLVACTTKQECIDAWGGVCSITGGVCAVNGDCPLTPIESCGGASCDYPTGVGGYCAPGFQYTGRTDGLLLQQLPAVDVSTPDFRYGSTLSPTGVPISDDGKLWYGGTLRLITSSDVAGAASVITSPMSFLKDAGNNPIPLVGLVDAYVICEIGQCCDLSITDDPLTPENEPCVSDTVCREQCEALVGGPYYWNPANTCADPCIQCQTPNGTKDPACADGDACTVDTCVDYFCDHAAVTLAATECCDWVPADVTADINGAGTITDNYDGNVCTFDVCAKGAQTCAVAPQCGVADNPPTPMDIYPCDDGNQCTYNDTEQCDGAGNMGPCAGLDVNAVPCTTPDDCLAETGVAFDCVNNFCLCVLEPPLNLVQVDPPADHCYDAGDKVEFNVVVGAAANVINGAQMTILWDPSCFAFESISPGGDPYTFEIMEILGVYGPGSVFYAVGVDPFGGVGTNGNATVAIITFTKLGECNTCNVCFGGENPYDTFLVDDDGYYVGVIPECSKDILDKDEVWLDCPNPVGPQDGGWPVDCDMRTREVYWDEPTAGGDCYPVNMTCWGEYPDGSPVPYEKVMHGGEFPIGMSEFWCEAYSKVCDTMDECSWTVTVVEHTMLDVVVQLSPIIVADDICRCIEFDLYANCVEDPFHFEECLRFGGMWDHIGHFTEMIKIPGVGQWYCITAKDQLHTLRATAWLECVDGVYYAVFKGDPFWGGNWLIGGNLDGYKKDIPGASLDVIDILDFGKFIAHYLEQVPVDTCSRDPVTGECLECLVHVDPAEGGFLGIGHADINGDGEVNNLDFAFIMLNFLASSKDACCPDAAAAEYTYRTEVSVYELRQMGLGELVVGDLNNDGLLNMEDMNLFAAGGIQKAPARLNGR